MSKASTNDVSLLTRCLCKVVVLTASFSIDLSASEQKVQLLCGPMVVVFVASADNDSQVFCFATKAGKSRALATSSDFWW
jgi:hypothetical protein